MAGYCIELREGAPQKSRVDISLTKYAARTSVAASGASVREAGPPYPLDTNTAARTFVRQGASSWRTSGAVINKLQISIADRPDSLADAVKDSAIAATATCCPIGVDVSAE